MRGFRGAIGALLLLVACTGGSEVDSNRGGDEDAGVHVILDGGGQPAEPPDGVAACPQGCNYQTSQGCDVPTPSCIPGQDGAGTPVPVCQPEGKGKAGALCEQHTDCAAGHLCAGKACKKLCCGSDWSACSKDESCFRHVEFPTSTGGVVDTGAMICDAVNQCDALVPASCTELGKTCQIVDLRGSVACAPEGTGESGQACPCKGGFYCVANACRRLCKAVEGGGEPYCQPDEGICVHFTRDPQGVGECTP